MPITDNKVVASDYTGRDIESLSDNPSSTTEEGLTGLNLRKRFDKVGKEVLAAKLNALIDDLGATTADDSGAANIGSEAITGVDGTTVRAQIIDLKDQIDGVALGSIPDGSITDAKLAADGVLADFADHLADYTVHIRILSVTTGTASAYLLSDASFDVNNYYFLMFIPHADCSASATINVAGTGARFIRTAARANVAAGQMKANGFYFLFWVPGMSVYFLMNPEPVPPTSLASLTITGGLAANTPGVPNQIYGTSATGPETMPDGSAIPIGTYYDQYTP